MDDVDDSAPAARRGAFMEAHVGHLLRRAYMRARRNTADALAALGDVSPVQASALAALMDGPLSQAELGRRIEMEPANTHGLVKRLIATELAEARSDRTNRRLSLVALTPAGMALADRMEAAIVASGGTTMEVLGDDERTQLVQLLQRIALPQG